MDNPQRTTSVFSIPAPAVAFASGDPEIQERLIPILRHCGLQPVVVRSVREIQMTLEREKVVLAFCTNRLPDGSFRDALRLSMLAPVRIPIVVASPLGDWEEYLEAMRLGAFDYVCTPYRFADVERVVRNALLEPAAPPDRQAREYQRALAACGGQP